MDEDNNSRQAEARRILDAIREQELSESQEVAEPEAAEPEKKYPRLASQEAEELQIFINSTIKSKAQYFNDEQEVPESVEPDPISNEQIKVMRNFVASEMGMKEPLSKKIYEFIIRAFFELGACFQPPKRKPKCQEDGQHTCIDCGAKIPVPGAEHKKNKINSP